MDLSSPRVGLAWFALVIGLPLGSDASAERDPRRGSPDSAAGVAASRGGGDGAVAPAFTLPRLGGGEPFALSSRAGSVVLVDFWASWCTPCRHSLPAYDTLEQSLGPRGFGVVAVNLDEVEDDARAFLAQHPLSYVVVRDASGDSARAYGVRGMPSSYLVGCDGTIRSREAGFRKQELAALRARIEALLGEKACRATAG